MRALLDVNVLIALHDRDHVHHERAALWLEANIEHGWASCPLTQNGCLRIMSAPQYSSPQPLPALVRMLTASTQTAFHAFWPDEASILDARTFSHDRIHTGRHLTDLYLLALAVQRQGRLVSFGQRIPLSAVVGAGPQHLVVL